MSLSAKMRRAPIRIVTGAFILNAGLEKLGGNDDTAKSLHGFASGAFPVLEKVDSKLFLKGQAVAETALGAALLLPIVPPAVAGLGLAAFSGGLLTLYWRTPGLHHDGNPRPTHDGTVMAKDSWMFGIGTTLVLDALLTGAHDKRVEATHRMKEAAAAKRAALSTATKDASKRALHRVGR
jgi:uncharacterized membrane protein YphA (DoxX/SURF4 family)